MIKCHKVYTKWKGARVFVLICVFFLYKDRDKDMGKGISQADVLIGLIRQLLGKVKLSVTDFMR